MKKDTGIRIRTTDGEGDVTKRIIRRDKSNSYCKYKFQNKKKKIKYYYNKKHK